MQNFFKILILSLILGLILQLFLPWWTIVLAPLISCIIFSSNAKTAVLSGFLSMFLLWTVWAWYLDSQNDSILSSQMGELFGGLSPIGLCLLSGTIAGVVGLLGGLTGWSFSQWNQSRLSN